MRFLLAIMFILIIALVLIPVCLHMGILIKYLDVKRHWIVLLVLMIMATSLSQIIEAKTGSFVTSLVFGLTIWLLGFLPMIYIDYLKKRKSISYKGTWKKAGDWLDQPVKTLFSTKE